MARRWRNTVFFQIRRTGVTAPWGCAGVIAPGRAAVFSGPTGSRISIPSRSMISFSMRISCWSSIGLSVSVSPGMNQFPGRSSPLPPSYSRLCQKFYRRSGTIPGAHPQADPHRFHWRGDHPGLLPGLSAPPVSRGVSKPAGVFSNAGSDRALPGNGAALETGA